MQAKNKLQSHILFLDGLRALAAIYVVMHHAMLQYYDSESAHLKGFYEYKLTGLKRIVILLLSQGHYAVVLFIVLSGFSLMLGVIRNNYLLKGGTLTFLKRRALRILPPYYISVAFSMMLIIWLIGNKTGLHWDVSLPVTKQDILYHLLLIHDFFFSSHLRINHVLWSVAVEFRIYLFFPLLVLAWKKWGALPTLLLSIVISATGTLILYYGTLYNSDINLGFTGVSPFIILFTLGMLAADIVFSSRNYATTIRTAFINKQSIRYLIFIIITGFVLILKIFAQSDNPLIVHLFNNLLDVVLGIMFTLFLVICSLPNTTGQSTWLNKLLSWKPLAFVGTFSFSLYLVHAPLLQVLSQYILAPLHLNLFTASMVSVLLGTAIMILISYGFFLAFERPFLNMGKKVNSALPERQ
ncbi:acyltransferase [Mucilaginibacter sp. PAMB04274]|uniref:acyltransferase family protein n=1 Tax=Mucilaginibacter sp. PAMB04274 TaxID=3138568 RepID=UPI0031F63486